MTNLLPVKAKIMYSGPIITEANRNSESDIRNELEGAWRQWRDVDSTPDWLVAYNLAQE